MAYGAVVRPAAHGAKLVKLADAADGAQVIHEGDFAGVVAPTRYEAERAAAELIKNSKWEGGGFPCSSEKLYDYLAKSARAPDESAPTDAKQVKATFHVAYVQHAPLEPRAAVAEWTDDNTRLTVWTGTQNPFGVRSELTSAFGLKPENVHVIVPDFGGGFGGKHSGECAVEAARLAKGAGKPVSLRWTREEEMTWAYYRPAGVIQASAVLGDGARITQWNFTNINSGQNAVEPPYKVGQNRSRYVPSKPPLRHGSYRALASTANTFGRECFMDECADAAGKDPLEFRLNHLEDARLRAVLEAAAKQFDWPAHRAKKEPNVGVGLACGTEKSSFVAACARVRVDPADGTVKVLRVTQAFECGKVINPSNLTNQNAGAIMMGLGAALREEVRFNEAGEVLTTNFDEYRVPRMADLPEIEVRLVDRPDLPSVGAGETPIIAIAPAVANAVFHATGQRLRSMPLKFPKT
jgi:isoquinoline 1-oxidoreductase